MKCTECPAYKDCSRKNDLRRKRGKCLIAKSERVPTNADRIRTMTDEELAIYLVDKTVYQESAWSKPSYLNFKTNQDDNRERALKDTRDWLQQPCGGADQ